MKKIITYIIVTLHIFLLNMQSSDKEIENIRLKRKNQALITALSEANKDIINTLNDKKALKLRLESLAINEFSSNYDTLNENFIDSLKELKIQKETSHKLADNLESLIYNIKDFLNTDDKKKNNSRVNLEIAIRSSQESLREILGNQNKLQTNIPIEQAKIVSIKKDLGLIIINSGKSSGMKIAQPIDIIDNESLVSKAIIIDVREKISGALVYGNKSNINKIKLGNSIKIDILKTKSNIN